MPCPAERALTLLTRPKTQQAGVLQHILPPHPANAHHGLHCQPARAAPGCGRAVAAAGQGGPGAATVWQDGRWASCSGFQSAYSTLVIAAEPSACLSNSLMDRFSRHAGPPAAAEERGEIKAAPAPAAPAPAAAADAAPADDGAKAKSKKSRARRLSYVQGGPVEDGAEGDVRVCPAEGPSVASEANLTFLRLQGAAAGAAPDNEAAEADAQAAKTAQNSKNTRARRLSYVTDAVRTCTSKLHVQRHRSVSDRLRCLAEQHAEAGAGAGSCPWPAEPRGRARAACLAGNQGGDHHASQGALRLLPQEVSCAAADTSV